MQCSQQRPVSSKAQTHVPAAALKTPSAAALLVQVVMCDKLPVFMRGDMRYKQLVPRANCQQHNTVNNC